MLKPGQRLGDFEIIRLLGKGGMGEVYEAKQFHPVRRVALKVLAPWLADNQESLQRFWNETQALAKLDHPGIVRIIATGAENDIAYYAMQLIQGVSLAALLRLAKDTDRKSAPAPAPMSTTQEPTSDSLGGANTKPYADTPAPAPPAPSPPATSLMNMYRTDRYRAVARIGLAAAQALAAAHRLGLVHRDIKPSNIMVDQHEHVYLVDFGLTRSLDAGAMTRAGILIGTPWYMSPEQASNAKIDCRSDVYSLGVTLYHLATGGEGPYTADRNDTEAVLEQVRGGALVPIRDAARNIPAPLADILTRALALDPARRYPSAAELADDLAKFLQVSAGSTTLLQPSTHKGVRAAFITGLAVAAAIFGAWLAFRDIGTPPPPIVQPPGDEDPFAGRERPLNARLPLLRDDMQPIRYKYLLGQEKGTLQPIGKELILRSMDWDKPFMVALDDPGNQPYEFSIEVKSGVPGLNPPHTYGVGLFFGFVPKAPDPRIFPRFFVLSLDNAPFAADIHGRLMLGTWMFFEPEGGIAPPREIVPVSLNGKSWVRLPPADGYREVRVRCEGERVTVGVGEEPTLKYELDDILRMNPKLQRAHVGFRGAFGIWVRNGLGHFRNAAMTALPKMP